MVGRPPLPVGIHGNVSTRQIRTKCFEAQCYVRDADGRRREVARRGASRSEAKTNLIKALGGRPAFGVAGAEVDGVPEGDELTGGFLAEALVRPGDQCGCHAPSLRRTRARRKWSRFRRTARATTRSAG